MDLTLILPLKGRTRFTERWLRWAESERLAYPVLIADGSSEEDARVHEALARDSSRWPHLRLDYRRYPHDAGLPRFSAKLADALARVETPFAALMDNDDFPVASGLEACRRFLTEHPGHAACGGVVAGMTLPHAPGDQAGYYAAGSRFGKHPARGDIDDPLASQRVLRQFERYQVTWYDVSRTKILRDVLTRVQECDFSNLLFMEMLASHLLAAAGPVRKIKELALVRQYDASGSSAVGAREGGAIDRMLTPAFAKDFSSFTGAIARALNVSEGLPLERGATLVREGYGRQIERSLARPRAAKGLRRMLGLWVDAAGLGRLRGRVSRAKAASWAGPEGSAALARLEDFLSRPLEARA